MTTDFYELLQEYVSLQTSLIAALMESVGRERDWHYLSDVPQFGTVRAGGDDWRFRRHGAGVVFESETLSIVVNAHCHLGDRSDLFDAGRLVEYVESLGSRAAMIALPQPLGFANMAQCLRQLADAGAIHRYQNRGELYYL